MFLFSSAHLAKSSSVNPTGPTEENQLTVEVTGTGLVYGDECPAFPMESDPIPNVGCDVAVIKSVTTTLPEESGNIVTTYVMNFNSDNTSEPNLQTLLIFSTPLSDATLFSIYSEVSH